MLVKSILRKIIIFFCLFFEAREKLRAHIADGFTARILATRLPGTFASESPLEAIMPNSRKQGHGSRPG